MIAAKRIRVERNERPILGGVDFRARAGQVTAILGANGAGKSTLLRVLCGEFEPEEGEVKFDGRLLADWPPLDLAKRRAVVPQSSVLNFPFSVAEVVMQGRTPHLNERDRTADEDAAIAALELVDLGNAIDRDYMTLSGGERQRVHLARALAQIGVDGEGKALLLDEPTSSLDLRHQHDVLRIVRRFADSGGCAVIVLHDLNLCARYADKVLLLHYGRELGSGDAKAVMTPEWLSIAYGISVEAAAHGGLPFFFAS